MKHFIEDSNVKNHLLLVVSVVILSVNRLLTAIPSSEYYPDIAQLIIFNGVQLVTLGFVGWVAVRFYKASIMFAALTAVLFFAVDHFGLRTLYLLIILSGSDHAISSMTYGVLVQSFLFFVPVVMLLGAVGGGMAKRGLKRSRLEQKR